MPVLALTASFVKFVIFVSIKVLYVKPSHYSVKP